MARISHISVLFTFGALLLVYQFYTLYEEKVNQITDHLDQKMEAIAKYSIAEAIPLSNNLDQKIRAIANDRGKGLNELLQPGQFVEIEPQECLQLAEFDGGLNLKFVFFFLHTFIGLKTKMCIKPLEIDIWVSGTIKSNGAFEYNIVNNVVKAMRKFETATFLGERRCISIPFVTV